MNKKDLVSGLLLVAVGLMFLAANFGTMPEVDFGKMWPVILIVLGGGKVLFPDDDGSRWSSLPLLLAGMIFLAHNYEVMSLRQSWPLFIVAAGVGVLAGACERRCSGPESGRGPS